MLAPVPLSAAELRGALGPVLSCQGWGKKQQRLLSAAAEIAVPRRAGMEQGGWLGVKECACPFEET